MAYLVDTNVLSEIRKARRAHPGVAEWSKRTPFAEQIISVLTLYEVWQGVERVARRDKPAGAALLRWARRLETDFAGQTLGVTAAIARDAASLQVPDPKPQIDALLAATARVHGLIMVTRNVRDFEALGVSVFDPWTGL